MAYPSNRSPLSRKIYYTDEWAEKAFLLWYSAGKPKAESLITRLQPPEGEIMPSVSQIKNLIRDYFVPKALELDSEVAEQLEHELVQEKVEMFRRHTEIAVDIQERALKYLENSGFSDAATALRALTAAIDIEKQSRGIDKVLADLGSRSDEQLLESLRKLVSSDTVEFLPESVDDDE